MWRGILVTGAVLVVGAYAANWSVGGDPSSNVATTAALILFLGVVVLAIGLTVAAVQKLRGPTQAG